MPDIRKVFGSRAIDPAQLTGAERLLYEGFQRRQQTNSTVRCMAGDGVPIEQIVRMTGLSRNLVRQILRGEREDAFRLRQSSLEQWLPWLTREWVGGCRNRGDRDADRPATARERRPASSVPIASAPSRRSASRRTPVFEVIGEALANGEEARILGFGAFGIRSRPARTGVT